MTMETNNVSTNHILTPKSSMFIGLSTINQPFLGVPFMESSSAPTQLMSPGRPLGSLWRTKAQARNRSCARPAGKNWPSKMEVFSWGIERFYCFQAASTSQKIGSHPPIYMDFLGFSRGSQKRLIFNQQIACDPSSPKCSRTPCRLNFLCDPGPGDKSRVWCGCLDKIPTVPLCHATVKC